MSAHTATLWQRRIRETTDALSQINADLRAAPEDPNLHALRNNLYSQLGYYRSQLRCSIGFEDGQVLQ